MASRSFHDISYQDYDRPARPVRRGPIPGTMMEEKINRITPQKYQYYDGASRVIGSPYEQPGRRNNNYTNLSFVSNAVFYEPSKNLGLGKEDMYTTTNNLYQSKSVGRLTDGLHFHNLKGSRSPSRPVRNNNHHRTNMTTLETEMCKNINQIYKERIGMRDAPKEPATECKPKMSKAPYPVNITQQNIYEEVGPSTPQKMSNYEYPKSRNKQLERCVTAPTLQTVQQVQREEAEDNHAQELPGKPPRIPCKQRSTCCEILREQQQRTDKKSLSRRNSHDRLEHVDRYSDRSDQVCLITSPFV